MNRISIAVHFTLAVSFYIVLGVFTRWWSTQTITNHAAYLLIAAVSLWIAASAYIFTLVALRAYARWVMERRAQTLEAKLEAAFAQPDTLPDTLVALATEYPEFQEELLRLSASISVAFSLTDVLTRVVEPVEEKPTTIPPRIVRGVHPVSNDPKEWN